MTYDIAVLPGDGIGPVASGIESLHVLVKDDAAARHGERDRSQVEPEAQAGRDIGPPLDRPGGGRWKARRTTSVAVASGARSPPTRAS